MYILCLGSDGRHVEIFVVTLRIQDGIGRHDFKFRLAGQKQMMGVDTLVIGPLGTIHQRSALYGDTATIVSHTGIGNHRTNWHVEMDVDDITLLPVAVDD